MLKIQRTRAKKTLHDVFTALCRFTDTSYSQKACMLFSDDPKRLTELKIDPSQYHSAYSFAMDYLIYSFGRKLEPFANDPSLKTEAFRRFIAAERHCSTMNEQFRTRSNPDSRLEGLLLRAQTMIGRILPSVRTCQKAVHCGFGPGATFSLKGEKANWLEKIREDRMSVTADAFRPLTNILNSDVALFGARVPAVEACGPFSFTSQNFEIVMGSRLVTVPKSAKTDRTICIEPSGNIMLQKGAGAVIRRALKQNGIDLNDQGNNQKLAQSAYRRKLATIDLEAASDTVCHGLVLSLLPLSWYLYLDALRSKNYMVDGKWYVFEKFSAMGNGFTFELESLLFLALCRAVVPEDRWDEVSVYGDDIIVPQEYAAATIELLAYCGFSTNMEKTFVAGDFFESCGKHYFKGHDVTPIYQKEYPNDEAEIYRMANRIYRFCCRQYGSGPDTVSCPKGLRRAWLIAWRDVKKQPLLIPARYTELEEDDCGLLSQEGRFVRDKSKTFIRGLFAFSKRIRVGDAVALAYTLRFEPEEPVTGLLSVRARPRYRYGMRRVWTQFLS